jgi:heavy metal translocating P-type ATPase
MPSRTLKSLGNFAMGSDLLAFLAIIGALLTQEYFAAGIIVLMLITGRVLEKWAEGQAERELKSLLSRMPRLVHRKNSSGGVDEIPVQDIAVGDILLVRSGEIVPTDGALLDEAILDESALTGEPLPISRGIEDSISSGVVNAGSPFYFRAETTSDASTYAGIIALVKQAQARSAPGVRIANSWALRFIPIALILAASAWAFTGDPKRAIAVLVIATPCPLILAVPISIVAGLSRAAKNGAVIKGGAVLELLSRAETVLLDKTGTLTHGGPAVSEINTAAGISDDQVLQLAASVDQYSPHIVAKALVIEAKRRGISLLSASEIKEDAGHHIAGVIDGRNICVGQIVGELPQWLHFSLPLMVGVEEDGELIGVIGLQDPVRPESKEMVAALRGAGVKHIALVTGDRDETAREVAEAVGITEVYSQVSAAKKLEITRSAQENSHGTVIVVGDGINDAPALAAADVGVAMGARGASAASEAADVVIVDDSIDRLTHAISIAQISRRKALQAAGIGMGLAFIGMFLGAFGLLSPSQGAIAQEFIDVIAILWALTALKN